MNQTEPLTTGATRLAHLNWLRVNWLRVNWLRVNWLRVNWLRVNWLRVNWLRVNWLRGFARAIRVRLDPLVRWFKRSAGKPEPESPAPSSVKIARYGLVLMDPDGQVVWTGEWDSGGVFEFRPRQRLLVFCGFTNHSGRETEISEYEIELMSEDGTIVQRFNDSFGDSLVIPPGQSKQFPAEWRM